MVNKAELLNQKVERLLEVWPGLLASERNPWVAKVPKDSNFYKEMTNFEGRCLFYQWLACLVTAAQPKVVVELGADQGGSAIFILTELMEKGILYSVDTKGKEAGWSYVPDWDKRIVKLTGDDLTAQTYPPDFPWSEVDLWLLDTEHSPEQVEKELEMIKPHLRENVVIVIHDIYLNDVVDLLKKQPWDFWEDERKVFNQGVGMFVV